MPGIDDPGDLPPQVPPSPEDGGKEQPLLLRIEFLLQVQVEKDGDQPIEDKIRAAVNDMLSDMMLQIQHRFDIVIEDGGHIILKDNPERAARWVSLPMAKKPS